MALDRTHDLLFCDGEAPLARGGCSKITCEGEIEETGEKGEGVRQQESCRMQGHGHE